MAWRRNRGNAPEAVSARLRQREFGHWQQPGIVNGGGPVPEPGEVFRVAGECEKTLNAGLPYEHDEVPILVLRSDQEWSTRAEKQEVAAGFPKQRQSVENIKVECFGAADRRCGRQFRIGRVVRSGSKTQ